VIHDPSPATAPAPPPAPPALAAPDAPSDHYVVVAGDCLWSIAARRLGGSAGSAQIDAAWRAIYAANRDAVGDDPGLIHPGLDLVLPSLAPRPAPQP
jgi:nucleoid-associated protein YgaU